MKWLVLRNDYAEIGDYCTDVIDVCDSKYQAEECVAELQSQGINTYIQEVQ